MTAIAEFVEVFIGSPFQTVVAFSVLGFVLYYFTKLRPVEKKHELEREERYADERKSSQIMLENYRMTIEKTSTLYDKALENSNRALENNTEVIKTNCQLMESIQQSMNRIEYKEERIEEKITEINTICTRVNHKEC